LPSATDVSRPGLQPTTALGSTPPRPTALPETTWLRRPLPGRATGLRGSGDRRSITPLSSARRRGGGHSRAPPPHRPPHDQRRSVCTRRPSIHRTWPTDANPPLRRVLPPCPVACPPSGFPWAAPRSPDFSRFGPPQRRTERTSANLLRTHRPKQLLRWSR